MKQDEFKAILKGGGHRAIAGSEVSRASARGILAKAREMRSAYKREENKIRRDMK